MTQRVNFSILFCTISILTAQAQWNKQDSITTTTAAQAGSRVGAVTVA